MLSYKNLAAIYVLLFFISCSIVKDSDVTSLDQLTKLKLKTIDIVQDLNGGVSTAIAIARDSAFKPVAVTVDFNTIFTTKNTDSVSKHTIINWPVFTNSTKLLFRSKISGSGIVVRNSYYKNGKLRYTSVFQNGNEREFYRYHYENNVNWKLIRIVSKISISVPSPDTTVYRDTLIYKTSGVGSGYVGSIIRNVRKPPNPDVISTTTVAYEYQTYGSDTEPHLGGTVAYNGYNYIYGNCNCPNGSGNGCSGCEAQTNNTDSRYTVTGQQEGNLLIQVQFKDLKNANGNCGGGSGGPTNYDTYYFHPFMLLRSAFTQGDVLLDMYAIDWWVSGTSVGNQLNNNEAVTLRFNYGR